MMADLVAWLVLLGTATSSVVAAVRSISNGRQLFEVKLAVNGRLDQLLTAERRITALEVEVAILRRLSAPIAQTVVEGPKAPETGVGPLPKSGQ